MRGPTVARGMPWKWDNQDVDYGDPPASKAWDAAHRGGKNAGDKYLGERARVPSASSRSTPARSSPPDLPAARSAITTCRSVVRFRIQPLPALPLLNLQLTSA